MTRPADSLPKQAGAALGTTALFLLLATPIGVLLGRNAIELAVIAIAGVGLAILHLTVVLAIHARDVEASLLDIAEVERRVKVGIKLDPTPAVVGELGAERIAPPPGHPVDPPRPPHHRPFA